MSLQKKTPHVFHIWLVLLEFGPEECDEHMAKLDRTACKKGLNMLCLFGILIALLPSVASNHI